MLEALTTYLLTLPERVLRSAAAVAGGLARELSEVAVPQALRETKLYEALAGATLRFLIEQVGQVEGAYPSGDKLAEDFVMRRAAGNGLEIAGMLAFRASPVWVLAALADLSGAGRHLIGEIAAELQKERLLDPGSRFETMDQVLAGLERSAGQAALAINTPPLDVAELRREWTEIRNQAGAIPLPAVAALEAQWAGIVQEAAAQKRSPFELSALLALSAIRQTPEGLAWFSKAAVTAAAKTGSVAGGAILGHYSRTLEEIRGAGYLAYWKQELAPYLKGAAEQFSAGHETWTERWLKRVRR